MKSSALYCSLVVRTPDVHRYIYSALYRAPSVGGRLEDCKERQQSRMILRELILHHADDKPNSGKGAQEHRYRDSTLSISEHKRRQNYPRQLSTFNFKYSIDQRLRLSGRRKTVTIIERCHPGSSQQASSVNEQKIISSKKFKRPYDSRDYLVKTQTVNFSMFLKKRL